MTRIGIKVKEKNNLYDAIVYYFNREQLEYELITDNYDYETIIYVGYNNEKLNLSDGSSLIIINDKEEIIEGYNCVVNYIVTNLVTDNTSYTDVQKEYLFSKGIYSVLIQKVAELIDNENNYDGLVYNLTHIKMQPYNWIFKFESISDTYSWLSKMNKKTSHNFVEIKVNFYSDKVYDESVREINYLTEIIMNIKNKKNLVDIFILNEEEFEKMKTNYFFKTLISNISDNYNIYLINKDEIVANDSELLNKLRDGIIVYEHCVYKDTYDDDYSLGFVDCKEETVKEYREYLAYIIDKYGKKLRADGEIDV